MSTEVRILTTLTTLYFWWLAFLIAWDTKTISGWFLIPFLMAAVFQTFSTVCIFLSFRKRQ